MATIKLPANGQTLTDIPDYIANDDQLLRDLLSPTMPDLANATFARKEVNGLLTVTVSKKAGTKGGETNHTPGPWEWYRDDKGRITDLATKNDTVITPFIEFDKPSQPACELTPKIEISEADARLVAAAPDLLADLESASEAVCSISCPSVWKTGTPQPHSEKCKQIQATIAKAKGKQ